MLWQIDKTCWQKKYSDDDGSGIFPIQKVRKSYSPKYHVIYANRDFSLKRDYIKYMPYALSISSLSHNTHIDDIMSQCYKSVDQNRTPRNNGLSYRVYPSVQIELVTECNNFSRSIPSFYVSTQLVSFIDSTKLCQVLLLNPISFIRRLQ